MAEDLTSSKESIQSEESTSKLESSTQKPALVIPYEQEIIADIKDKKELRTLDEDFIKNKLDIFFNYKSHDQEKKRVLQKLSTCVKYKQFTKSKEYKFLIKEMRAELRRVYGVFILEGYEKRKKLLDELKELLSKSNSKNKDDDVSKEELMEIHQKLFQLHKSTKERMSHYDKLYETIFETISALELQEKIPDESLIRKVASGADGKDLTFMDLACGLNPISSIIFKDKIKRYYASDISTEDCEFLKEYFDVTKVDAIMFPADLTNMTVFPKLSKIHVDICFIFKTLDGLERIKRDISEDLMKAISTKYFAITFPTLTISGHREIKEHRRLWLERLLEKLNWTYAKFTLESELLYVIKKK
jgi:hypothetical protein